MSTTSRLAYRIPEGVSRFEAEVGLDVQAGTGGSVIFRVFVTRPDAQQGRVWEDAATTQPLLGGDPRQSLAVDVSDADQLVILVEFADRGDERDYANWCYARFVP